MTDNFTEEELTNLAIPTVEVKRHQQALRQALLASSHWDKKSSLLSNFILHEVWKGSEETMNYKRLALSGLVVAVLVAGIAAMSIIRPGNSTVYAKEIAQESLQTVSRLSTEEKEKLEIKVDTESLLEEAQNAKDLTVLTYDQVKDMLPHESEPGVIHENCPEKGSEEGGVITHENHPEKESEEGAEPEKILVRCGEPSNEDLEKLEQAKFLRFTSSQGLKVLLGIDQDNLPIFTLVGSGK